MPCAALIRVLRRRANMCAWVPSQRVYAFMRAVCVCDFSSLRR